MPGCAWGNAPLPFSTSPTKTSSCFAPTVSGPIRRKLFVPWWLAGEYGFTSAWRMWYLLIRFSGCSSIRFLRVADPEPRTSVLLDAVLRDRVAQAILRQRLQAFDRFGQVL